MTSLDEVKVLAQQVEALSQAAELAPERAHLFHAAQAQACAMLAASYWRQGGCGAAQASFDQAIALQPLASWRRLRTSLGPCS